MTPAQRKAAIAKIHIGKKQLGWDDELYRAVLKRVGGVETSSRLSDRAVDTLLAEMRDAGAVFTGQGKYGRKPKITHPARESRDRQLQKIEALLADKGLPWGYLLEQQTGKDGLAKPSMLNRLTGVDSLEWCKPYQLSKIIAALSVQQRREGRADE